MEPSQVFIKNECIFMENFNNTSKLNQLKIQEKLLKAQKECDELREELTRSKENEKVSTERFKRAEEKCNKLYEEKLQITNDKDQIISKLNDKLKFQVLETETMRQKNSQTVKELRDRITFLEVEKKESDQALEEMRNKEMEAEKAMDELSRKKEEAFRTIKEFKDLVGAVGEVFEENNNIWDVFKVKVFGETVKEATGVTSPISKGCGDSLPMSTGINGGGENGDGSPGQDVSQIPNCSPRVEANCCDLEKGSERTPGCGDSLPMSTGISEGSGDGEGSPGQAVLQTPNCSPRVEGPVQVDSDGESVPGELDYNSDSPANLAEKGKTDELPSLKLPLSLITYTLRRKRGTHENVVEYLLKRQKKEQAQKPSHKRVPKTPIPVLRRCKKKAAVASDSQIPIWNIDSSPSPVLRRCKKKADVASDSQIPIWNIDSASSED